jgi:hypothetical protein
MNKSLRREERGGMMGYVVGGVLLTLGLEILIRWSQRVEEGAWRKAGQGHTARAQQEKREGERS